MKICCIVDFQPMGERCQGFRTLKSNQHVLPFLENILLKTALVLLVSWTCYFTMMILYTLNRSFKILCVLWGSCFFWNLNGKFLFHSLDTCLRKVSLFRIYPVFCKIAQFIEERLICSVEWIDVICWCYQPRWSFIVS